MEGNPKSIIIIIIINKLSEIGTIYKITFIKKYIYGTFFLGDNTPPVARDSQEIILFHSDVTDAAKTSRRLFNRLPIRLSKG